MLSCKKWTFSDLVKYAVFDMLWRLTGNMSPRCVCMERVDIKVNRQHPRMTAGGSRSMECIDCGFLLACLVQQCIDLCWTASVTLCVCVPCVYTHTHTTSGVCVCVCLLLWWQLSRLWFRSASERSHTCGALLISATVCVRRVSVLLRFLQ